jgi:hypothetical protein
VTAFAFDAGQARISRFASAADQVGQRATRFDGGGKARHDRMVELVETMLKLRKVSPKARTAPDKTARGRDEG